MIKENLSEYFEDMKCLEEKFLREAETYLSFGDLQLMDLFTSSIINRAIFHLKGFVSLASDNNYICAVPLIRMQLDNSLRFFATTLVPDHNQLYLDILNGATVANLKSIEGKNMTDSYLTEKLEYFCPGIKTLYKTTSGYIHLSNEHTFLQTKPNDLQEKTFETKIGNHDFFTFSQKIDFSANMIMASEILLKLVGSWKIYKFKVRDEKGIAEILKLEKSL